MKKTKVYLIVPLVVLIVFGAYYWSFKSDYDAKQATIVAAIKEQKLEKLRQAAVLREAAIRDAIEAQNQRKKERQERDAREQKQKDDKENAKLNADKAVQEEQKLERQVEKVTGDVKTEKEEIVKIEAENKKAVAEEAFLKEYVKMAQDNQASLAAVLTKIAAAAAAAAAAKKYPDPAPYRESSLMKKWMYVLGPGLMLAVFLFFYFASKSETDARLKEEKAHKEQVEKDAEAKKQAAEAKARADAEARNAQRTTDEAKIAKDKQDKYDSDMRRIKDDTDKASANAETYAKQVSELTIELDTLRKQKDTMTRDGFDLAKHVELAEVARRNAELEIQRMVEMIANRADQSTMTKMPPPPPPPKES